MQFARVLVSLQALVLISGKNIHDCTTPCKFLLYNNADVNAETSGDVSGVTALMFAAENNCKETTEILLQNNADINAKTEFNETPLTFAVKYNPSSYGPDINMLKLLIKNGADVNAKSNVNGETALIIASYR